MIAYFITDVKYFMSKNIDPIVLPGTFTSHMHDFFGSDSVTKDLPTSAELQAGCSSADNPHDKSIYWIPTLYHVKDDGSRTPIQPKRFVAYYNFEKTEADVPIPQDFNVLAGNADGKTVDDVIRGSKLTWLCEKQAFDAGGKEHSQYPLSTCSGGVLQSVLWFPDCVNPETLKSDYSSGGSCPEGMFSMPQLRFSIRYDVRSIGSWEGEPPLELACGPSYCFHGDFINGWDESYGEVMRAGLTKARSVQKLEGYRAGTECKDKPTDADPENGTSDYEESLKMMNGGGSDAGAPAAPKPTPTQQPSSTPSAEAEESQAEDEEDYDAPAPTAPAVPATSDECKLKKRSPGKRRHRRETGSRMRIKGITAVVAPCCGFSTPSPHLSHSFDAYVPYFMNIRLLPLEDSLIQPQDGSVNMLTVSHCLIISNIAEIIGYQQPHGCDVGARGHPVGINYSTHTKLEGCYSPAKPSVIRYDCRAKFWWNGGPPLLDGSNDALHGHISLLWAAFYGSSRVKAAIDAAFDIGQLYARQKIIQLGFTIGCEDNTSSVVILVVVYWERTRQLQVNIVVELN
ncbi:hypothetical protein HJFPF1_10285 [Paramyrothecium foliicola]|nr:hypothetical protein HJFPF1_10285 [Paramyrothecium foliicola]